MPNSRSEPQFDDTRIDVVDYFELRTWAKMFGVTAGEVRRAVAAVGNRAVDVAHWLREHRR